MMKERRGGEGIASLLINTLRQQIAGTSVEYEEYNVDYLGTTDNPYQLDRNVLGK